MKIFLLITLIIAVFSSNTSAQNRWTIENGGGIKWSINSSPHKDHIEMSGEKISTILRYGVNEDKSFTSNRIIVFPMLRTIPNNTHASLTRQFNWNITDLININKTKPKEEVASVETQWLRYGEKPIK